MKRIYIFFSIFILSFGLIKTYFVLKAEKNKTSFVVGISPWIEPQYDNNVEGFKAALTEAGFTDGKNIRFIEKNPEGYPHKQKEIIKSFIREKADLIYVLTLPGAQIAKSLTKDIPIVFSLVLYPVESGLVNSLENSGNNLTGTRHYVPAAKQFFAFERLVPFVETIAFVHGKGDLDSARQLEEFKTILTQRNIDIVDISAENIEDLENQLEQKKDIFDTLYLACDPFVSSGADKIAIAFAKKNNKPNFACSIDAALNGALVGNVVNFYNIGKMSGQKASLILKGANPGWIRVQTSQETFVVINKETAEELGIILP